MREVNIILAFVVILIAIFLFFIDQQKQKYDTIQDLRAQIAEAQVDLPVRIIYPEADFVLELKGDASFGTKRYAFKHNGQTLGHVQTRHRLTEGQVYTIVVYPKKPE